MKILYVLDSLGTGGAERSTADLWYYLRDQGIEPTIVVLRHRSEGIQTEILQHGFKVHFLKSKGFVFQCLEIIGLIKEFKPTIVHSILFKSNLRTRISRLWVKFVHVESLVNCTYDRVRLKDPRISKFSFYLHKYMDRMTQRLTDRFLAITEAVRKHYISEQGIPPGKIEVLYRGRDENSFISQRPQLRATYLAELELPWHTILILHVGRQEFQKGHLVLLSAIKTLEKNSSKDFAFVFLGRKGNSTPDISRFLTENSLRTKLFWLDHRYDVAQWMVSSDIFVFPSLFEGLGGSLIEAQAAALPIICTNLPVLNEVVLRDQNALMFEPGNDSELAASLKNLIEDDVKRKSMGEESIRNFRNKFLLRGINEQTFSYYNRLAR